MSNHSSFTNREFSQRQKLWHVSKLRIKSKMDANNQGEADDDYGEEFDNMVKKTEEAKN